MKFKIMQNESQYCSGIISMWKNYKGKLLGWPKCPYGFFHEIKDTLLIFTNNFIDLDILSMSAVSHVV